MEDYERNWNRIMHYANEYGFDEGYARMCPEHMEALFKSDDGFEYADNMSNDPYDYMQPSKNDAGDKILKQLLKGVEERAESIEAQPKPLIISDYPVIFVD